MNIEKQVKTDIAGNVVKNGSASDIIREDVTYGRYVWWPEKNKRGKGEGL